MNMHGHYIIDELTARHPAIGVTLLTLHLKQPDEAVFQRKKCIIKIRAQVSDTVRRQYLDSES